MEIIGFDPFLWNSRTNKIRRHVMIDVNFDIILELSEHLFGLKNDFLDGEPDYFSKYPEDPEPLYESELLDTPQKILSYSNSPAWGIEISSWLAKKMNWIEFSKSNCLAVGIDHVIINENYLTMALLVVNYTH